MVREERGRRMAPVTSSLKTHSGSGSGIPFRSNQRQALTSGMDAYGSDRLRTNRRHHYQPPRRRFFGDESFNEESGGSLPTPTPVQQSSEGEEGPPWYLGNGDCCRFGDDVDGGLSDACTAQSRDHHKEEPVLPGTRTEIDVIRDWFLNIFQPVEKTADIEVIDFRFEAVRRKSRANVAGPRLSNPSSRSARAKDPTTSEPSAPEASLALGKLMDDRGRLHRCDEFDLVFDDETLNGNNFRVLKKAEVDLKVNGKPKQYSVIIKVLPTDDPSRHCDRRKFYYLMKFGKEAQVYHDVIQCMAIYDEKRYPSACVEPPVPKCYLSQFDNQNDVMVLEDLEFSGYKKYDKGDHISDVDHCRVVLRRLAHFHAISTLIQRDSEMCLVDLFPFVIDAVAFRQRFRAQVANVRRQLLPYLNEMRKKKRDEKRNGSRNDKHEQLRGLLKEYGLSTATLDSRRPRLPNGTEDDPTSTDESQDKDRPEELLEKHFEDLFWKLVELRAPPGDRRLSVLVHGGLDLSNIVFQYDEASGRPICAKFLDFSTLTVSSPVIDITYFLHRSVQPGLARTHHATLLQHYHRAHTEAIKSFGMHGFELELETLLNEYQAKQDVGAMMGCLLKPAFFVLQNINAEKDKERENGGKNGAHLSSSASKSKSGPTNKSLPSGPGGPSESSLTTEDDDSHVQNGLTNGRSPRNLAQEDEPDEDDEEQDLDESLRIRPTIPTEVLKLDKSLVPIDLQLHQHLAQLTKECGCPCQYSGGDAQDTNGSSGQPRNGDRGACNRLEDCELTMAELSSDSLEDLHILARQQLKNSSGLKTFDCGGGTSGNPLKKLIRGLIPHSSHPKDQANNTTGASASESQPTKGKDEKKS